MEELFGKVGIIFALAVWGGVIAKYFGLPALLGNLLVGLCLKDFLGFSELNGLFSSWGSIGVTLLLFLAGLEFSFGEFKKSGRQVLFIAFMEVVVFGLISFLGLRYLLGWSSSQSLLISWVLTFSSTVVVVKLLADKRDTVGLVGRLSLGLLLVQDLCAIILLLVLPWWNEGVNATEILLLVAKLILLLVGVLFLGEKLIGWLVVKLVRGAEDSLLFGLGWCFTVVFLAIQLGLSKEIGGFLAGVSLASSWKHHQILSKVGSVRDFFVAIYFLVLGYSIKLDDVSWLLVLGFSVWVLVGKLVLVWLGARLVGIRQRAAFMTGLNVVQLSEFTLVALGLSASFGYLPGMMIDSMNLVVIVTMILSVLLINNNRGVFSFSERFLNLLWKDKNRQFGDARQYKNHIVLIGCHRMGKSILVQLEKLKEKVVIIDFDPDVVAGLKRSGREVVYGDVSDEEVLKSANVFESKMIISTVRDIEDSLSLISWLKSNKVEVPVIVDAESIEEAKRLYESGAVYVVFPHFLGGWHLGQLLKKMIKRKDVMEMYKKRQEVVMEKVYEV